MANFTDIAITGASGGLGHALALAYARPDVRLHLSGRDATRLAATTQAARDRGAEVTETIFDVTDAGAAEAWVKSCGRLDLLIANAGISAGPGSAYMETPSQIRAVFDTNVNGVFNTTLPAIDLMAAQPRDAEGQRGRVAVIGSVAGLIALPTSPSYSASKAMLDFWITASAPNAAKAGIGLTLVRPGFIRTPMTAKNPYKMPGIMNAETAAGKIIAGLEAGQSHITFPWWMGVYARLGQALPKSWLANLPSKPPGPEAPDPQ